MLNQASDNVNQNLKIINSTENIHDNNSNIAIDFKHKGKNIHSDIEKGFMYLN